MRVNADEYHKFRKPQIFMISSRDCYNLFAIEKQQEMKTFEQNCVSLILRHIMSLSFSH